MVKTPNKQNRWRLNGVLSFCLSVSKGVASGTLFSCQRHFIFFLSLTIFSLTTKAEIATWDCWCLSKEGCCSHAVEQHQGFGQSEHKNLIVFFGNRFLFKSSPKQVHASWYIPQHSSPAPLLHFLPPSFQHRLSFYHLLHPLLLWKTSIHKSILLQGELCVSSMSKKPRDSSSGFSMCIHLSHSSLVGIVRPLVTLKSWSARRSGWQANTLSKGIINWFSGVMAALTYKHVS